MKNFSAALMRHRNSALSLLVLLMLGLSACGFQLRGMADLSFKNLYIQGGTLSISKDLKQTFKTNGGQVMDKAEDAELHLELLDETNEKRILSLSGGGLVREYELNYRVNFRMREPADPTWGTVQSVQTRRDFSYDDKALLSKAEEESRLNASMRHDAIREILRRLAARKPTAK